MKTLILFFLLLSQILLVQGQSQDIQWQRCYGGSNADRANCIMQTNDGGYLFTGSSWSADGDIGENKGEEDIWVVKIDGAGNIGWSTSLGGSLTDQSSCILETDDNAFIVAGNSNSNDGDVSGNHGEQDFWILKIDITGSILWQKTFGGSLNDQAHCISKTQDGGYMVAGQSESNDFDVMHNNGEDDGWIIKLDMNGQAEWMNCYGGSLFDAIHSIYPTQDGGYVAAGNSLSTDGDINNNYGTSDCWVIRLNGTGAIEWSNNYGGSHFDKALSVKETSDLGYIVSGFSQSNDNDVSGNHGKSDFWLMKLNTSGSIEWQECLGGSEGDGAFSMNNSINGGYMLAGPSRSIDGDVHKNYGVNDYWVIETNHNGEIIWQNTFGGSENDSPGCIVQTSDNGYIVAGHTSSNDLDVSGNHGSTDAWIVKINPDVGINELTQNNLIDIFPNPATSVITIRSSIFDPTAFKAFSKEARSSIFICDLYGRKLDEIIIPKGQTQTRIDVSDYPAGLYVAVLKDENGNVARGKFVKR